MSKIEKMQKYIERTKMNVKNPLQYTIRMNEAFELVNMGSNDGILPIEAIFMAFEYGMAKGYRAAKAEQKRAAV